MSKNNIPRDWNEVDLGECISVLTDYTANGSFAALKENVQYFNTPEYACLVRTTDLEKKIFTPERYTDKKGYDFLSKSSLKAGDIVIANVGSTGKAYKVPEYHMPMTLAPNMYLVKFKSGLILQDYAFYILTSSDFFDALKKTMSTTTLSAINKTSFRGIRILLPPLDRQKEIVKTLTSVDDVIKVTNDKLTKTLLLKQSLVKDLLWGRVN